MSRAALIAALLLLACVIATRPGHAQGAVNRCVNAAGENIYSDQACSDMRAIDRPAQGSNLVSSGHRIVVARTCARKPDELLSDVRNALAAQDVNRLAGSYFWTGMGSREAYSLMDRLNAFSARPLIDAQLVSRVPEPDPYATNSAPEFEMPESAIDDSAQDESAQDQPAQDDQTPDEQAAPAPVAARRPELIRVEQTRSAKDAETATSYLRIVPAAGCLWVSF